MAGELDKLILNVGIALVNVGAPKDLSVPHIRIAVEAGVRFGKTFPVDPEKIRNLVDLVTNSECKCDMILPCPHDIANAIMKELKS